MPTRDVTDVANHCITRLDASDDESAWHAIRELGADALPHLASRFRTSSNTRLRATLVELAWQTRSTEAFPLLAEALAESEPTIWRQALDGLVTLGGEHARAILHDGRVSANSEKASWIDEALDQARG